MSSNRRSSNIPRAPPSAAGNRTSLPPQFNIPDYSSNGVPTRPVSDLIAPGTPNPTRRSRAITSFVADSTASQHRGSNSSDKTLAGDRREGKYSLSSYEHPYDIQSPPPAYSDRQRDSINPPRPTNRRSVNFAPPGPENDWSEPMTDERFDALEAEYRRRGIVTNLMELYGIDYYQDGRPTDSGAGPPDPDENVPAFRCRPDMRRNQSVFQNDLEYLDPDDPRVTGEKKNQLDDAEDVEKACLKQIDYRNMDYKTRRKEKAKIRIEFNITSIYNRHIYLMTLAKALLMSGAPSHRIESQLVSCAHILEVDAEFVHIPGVIFCSFHDEGSNTSKNEIIKCGSGIDLKRLHDVHQIYRSVVHDEISAKKATEQLEELMDRKPPWSKWFKPLLAFGLSALICPLGFGGSFLDLWIAGIGGALLAVAQVTVADKSRLYGHIFEITTAMMMSFLARALSSIHGDVFCYTSISSAGIVSILPGYLILTSSLELASRNIVCGSVKMVYALIYTLSIGFGLQIGSDFFLLLDPAGREQIQYLAANATDTITLTGNWTADYGADVVGMPRMGTFSYTNSTGPITTAMVAGCYRPDHFPWYLQPFPWWTQFFLVPTFSILSSIANLQPFWSIDMFVMVVISSTAYAANKVANHFIFNRSDVVSAIGAFVVGLLGNIYSRRFGGTAFTVMVTGVLFLVPSGLSAAGGVTADGTGIDVGRAMISVTIGVTVGLFMSQAVVYAFGMRKNAAVFSF